MDRASQLRQFIANKPADPFPRYALALELKGAGDATAAAAELEELLARTPDYLAAYLQLAMLYQLIGKLDSARARLEAGQRLARTQGNSHTLAELTSALEALA